METPAIVTAVKRLTPLFNRVLIKKLQPKTYSKGGIVLPENAASRILEGKVVAIGPGYVSPTGLFIESTVKPGDNVILPECEGTKVVLPDDQVYYLYREHELLARIGE